MCGIHRRQHEDIRAAKLAEAEAQVERNRVRANWVETARTLAAELTEAFPGITFSNGEKANLPVVSLSVDNAQKLLTARSLMIAHEISHGCIVVDERK
jgi:hypothetical protein